MAEISTGTSGLSPADDAKGEECRVLEVDDIDELLTGIQAEPRLGSARSFGAEHGRQLSKRFQRC